MSFSSRGGWWVVAQVALIGLFVLSLVSTAGLDEGFGLGFARVVGWGLVAAAATGAGWAVGLMGRSLTPFPTPAAGASLIERGPYRVVRHPMYGALTLGAIGIGLIAVNPWALIVALLFPVFFTAKAGLEEEMLLATFPGYREYRSRVPHRLIPWVL